MGDLPVSSKRAARAPALKLLRGRGEAAAAEERHCRRKKAAIMLRAALRCATAARCQRAAHYAVATKQLFELSGGRRPSVLPAKYCSASRGG